MARLWLSSYRALTGLLAIIAPLWLAWRTWTGKEDRRRRGERYGREITPRPSGRLIWCHGASVGESLTVLPLLAAILKNAREPTHILVTTGTLTSAKLMAERLPAGAFHRFVPLDHGPWIGRFLDHWRPDAILWMESELWPNTLVEIAKRNIPAAIINGRLSDKALKGWQRAPGLSRLLLGAFRLVLAQSPEDGRRFEALGAQDVRVTGNLKLAASPLPADPAVVAELKAMTTGRATWLAASIHPGEDVIAADVHRSLRSGHRGLLTILVPRHADKGLEMAAGLRALGLDVACRSERQPVTPATDIYIADTMGELGVFYRACDTIFMGKSLAVGGGQNPAEAALMGCAIVLGPDMSNFRDMTDALCRAEAAVQVQSATELTATIDRLLRNDAARRRLGENARAFMTMEGRSLTDTLAALAPLLSAT